MVSTERQISSDQLRPQARELARAVALAIYSKFGWAQPAVQKIASAQDEKFGAE